MDAFDSDVLIYAAIPGHSSGSRVHRLFATATGTKVGLGSLLLLPEVLAKPMRTGDTGDTDEITLLTALLSRLDLRPVNPVIAEMSTTLAAAHRLKAADAVHLATAVVAGASRFITNNRKNFPTSIPDIEVVYPEALR